MRRWLSALLALGAVACNAPTLNENGSIHCGTQGECPHQFECRWGDCCPTSSTMATCPPPGMQYQHDTTGTLYPPLADGSCPSGFENRVGHCCPTDAGSECPQGVIGAHCTSDQDCAGAVPGLTPLCLTTQYAAQLHQEFPRGYCIAIGCDPSNPASCGPNGFCTPDTTMPTTGYCFRSCTLATGALAGPCQGSAGSQFCITRRDTGDPTAGLCFPDCSRPENMGQCDMAAGYTCQEPITSVHACSNRCNLGMGILCPGIFHCSALSGEGTCTR